MYTGILLSERVPLSRPPLRDSYSYRNVLVIGIPIMSTVSLSEQQIVLITSTVSLSERSDNEYGRPYSLSVFR